MRTPFPSPARPRAPRLARLLPLLLLPAAAPAAKAPPPPPPATLRIVSEPAGATAFLNGEALGETPVETTTAATGTALLKLRLRDHREWWGSVELSPGAFRSVDARLEPVRAAVLVHVEPAGAAVSLDGAHAGFAPLLLPGVGVGRHRLSVSEVGYQPRSVELDVRNATPQRLDIRLDTDSATLRVACDPAGATVYLDGIPRGDAPVVVERIPEGTVTLELRAKGYRTFRQDMRLSAGDDRSLSLALEPLPASLRILSEPAGARVYLDDTFRGESPLALENLEPGPHRVRLDLDAHDSMARTVELHRAEEAVEEFHLVPNCGTLRICTSPAGVTVLVDGKRRGITVARDEASDQLSEALDIDRVLAGEREVLFVREGYHELRRTVQVGRDQTATLDVRLRRRFIPDFEVRTAENVYRGVFQNRTAEFLRIETEPGVTRAFPLSSIVSARPLREDELVEIPTP